MAPLPLFKLFYIASKQIAKPISKQINRLCANSDFTRNSIVVPLGQAFNWGWVRLARVADGSTRRRVRPLPEQDAVQMGGEIIAESFLFLVAAGFVIEEYRQKDIKEDTKKAALKESLDQLGSSIEELNKQIGDLNSQVTTLQREAEERARSLEKTATTDLSVAPQIDAFDYIPGVRSLLNIAAQTISATINGTYAAADFVEESARTPLMLLGRGVSSLLDSDSSSGR